MEISKWSLLSSASTILVIMLWYFGVLFAVLPKFFYFVLPFLFVLFPLTGIVLGVISLFKKEWFGTLGVVLGLGVLIFLWSMSSVAYL